MRQVKSSFITGGTGEIAIDDLSLNDSQMRIIDTVTNQLVVLIGVNFGGQFLVSAI